MHLRLILPALLLATAAHAQDVSLSGPGQPATTMTVQQLQALPQSEITYTSGNPPAPHRLQGPLLWTVLTQGHLVDPDRHSDAVRQTLRLTGDDRYVAIIAMGELSPEFENKPALLALTMDGKPLARPRAYIPGDHRGGRGVHDIVSLTLDEVSKP